MDSAQNVVAAAGRGDSLEQLQSIFEHLADGVFVVQVLDGPDFVFEAINAKTAETQSASNQ